MRILDRKWVICSLDAWEYLIFLTELNFPPDFSQISALMSLYSKEKSCIQIIALSMIPFLIFGLNPSY